MSGPIPDPGAMPAPGPLPDPGALIDPARLQSTEATRTYPCPACGGTLVFDPTTQDLRCPSCGNRMPLTQQPSAGPIGKHDLGTTMNQLHALQQGQAQSEAQGTTVQSLDKEIVCQSCGGRTTFTGTMSATRCPYCNTPIQRDDLQTAPARLPVDGVLPFAVDQKTAQQTIEQWVRGRRFAPREFKTYREIGSFTSIYLTYFSYDAVTTTSYTGQRGDHYTVTVGHGENQRRETRTRWSATSGVVADQFADLTTSANAGPQTGLDDALVAALEPWPVTSAQPYNQQYVAGHLSRTYDADAGQVFEGAVRGQIEGQVESTIRRDIGGDQQRVEGRDIHYDHLAFAQLLLPVWLLTVTYQQRPFQVFINGVTGEVQGQRPYSAVKITLFVLAVVAALVVAYLLYRVLG